jgi:hypothetical protein
MPEALRSKGDILHPRQKSEFLILVPQIEQLLDAAASGIEVFLACEVPERL